MKLAAAVVAAAWAALVGAVVALVVTTPGDCFDVVIVLAEEE